MPRACVHTNHAVTRLLSSTTLVPPVTDRSPGLVVTHHVVLGSLGGSPSAIVPSLPLMRASRVSAWMCPCLVYCIIRIRPRRCGPALSITREPSQRPWPSYLLRESVRVTYYFHIQSCRDLGLSATLVLLTTNRTVNRQVPAGLAVRRAHFSRRVLHLPPPLRATVSPVPSLCTLFTMVVLLHPSLHLYLQGPTVCPG